MAAVKGIREKVHLPIYDSVVVEPKKQLRDLGNGSTLKFFVDVQRKNKLETNLQSASLLPHFNTFEARALRVVLSDLPPEFPDAQDDQNVAIEGDDTQGYDVTDDQGNAIDSAGEVEGAAGYTAANVVTADLEIDLKLLMKLLKEAQERDEDEASLDVGDPAVTLDAANIGTAAGNVSQEDAVTNVQNAGGKVRLPVFQIEDFIDGLDKKAPPLEQIRPNNGAGNIISKFVFNTVTTLYVGEKIMIEMPTWFFPGGAGAYSFTSKMISHGEPTPMATFRFAEPIFIDRQQNFRVELDIPDSDVHKEIQKIYGPLFVWVVIDGYMTRDVQ
jgi:hypothetical protein